MIPAVIRNATTDPNITAAASGLVTGILTGGLPMLMFQQVPAADILPGVSLSQFGLLGVVLGWLMWRVEKRLDEIRKGNELVIKSQNHQAESLLILAMAVNPSKAEVVRQANDLLAEIKQENLSHDC